MSVVDAASARAGHALALGAAVLFTIVAVTALVLLLVHFRRHRGVPQPPSTRRLLRVLLALAVGGTLSGVGQVVILLVWTAF